MDADMSAWRMPSNGAFEDDEVDLAAQSLLPVLVTARLRRDRAVCARAIHARSAVGLGPFVVVHCQDAHGADDLDGWFERARAGTLFLDEVACLTRRRQAQLLRRLADEIGGRPSGQDGRVRIIAGASRPLGVGASAGTFSEALFYRLNIIHIDRRFPRRSSRRT